MYVIFGSCKDITVGPTAIMSLLTAQYAPNAAFAVLLSFLTGLIVLLLGLLRLGEYLNFFNDFLIFDIQNQNSVDIHS